MPPPYWSGLSSVGNALFSFQTNTLGATQQKPWVSLKTRCHFGALIYRWVGTPNSSYKTLRSFCGMGFVLFTNALPLSRSTRRAPHTLALRSLSTQNVLPLL